MTQCKRIKTSFAKLNHKRVEADFGGGRLTTDGGALLLREADRALGLTDRLSRVTPDPRDPRRTTHPLRELLAQRIFGIALGYEDLCDHNALRDDPALQTATGRDPGQEAPLGSAPTLCRLENSVNRETLVQISELLVDIFIGSYEGEPEELVLDFDATDDPLHGQQEGRFFHGYYDCYCYLPLYVFCQDRPLVALLRPSGIDASLYARAILKILVRKLREAWPEVSITMRGDSDFCRWETMRWCDNHGVDYTFGIARNSRLEAFSEELMEEAERLYEATGQKVRLFGEFPYAAGTWDKQRRVVCKAERLPRGPNLRFVVTSLSGAPQTVYDEGYCARGDMENRIKEQQLQLFSDRTSCRTMLANQFRLLLSTLAYVLVEHIRRVGLRGTEMARAEAGTIRTKLLKIGARILSSVRRIAFRLASGYPWKRLFLLAARRLSAAPAPSG